MREDGIVIKAIQHGDEEAMEELVYRYYDEIFYYIYRLGSSYEEAKDLTQEVFIAMMKALPKYKEQGNFKAWLYKIAHNRSLNHFRQNKKQIYLEVDLERLKVDVDFSEQLTNQVLIKELLNTLPKKQRSTLLLKYYHGFTIPEIARITGSTVPAVKSRLFQGLQKLKKMVMEGN